MADDDQGGSNPANYEILILSMNSRYWLLKGEKYLTPMLSGSDDFPTPIGCIVLDSPLMLRKYIPEEIDLGELWMIQPNVMARIYERGVVNDLRPKS